MTLPPVTPPPDVPPPDVPPPVAPPPGTRPPVAPRLGERRVRFTADGVGFDLVVPNDMSVLQILRDIAGHPRPAWRCELGVCGSCESLMNGETVRLCTFGPKRLDGAVIVTPEPRPDPGPLFP